MKQRQKEVLRSVLMAAVILGGNLFLFCVTGHGFPCLFRLLTGYLCPGCGMTRAAAAFLKGRFGAAWQANALFYLYLPVLGLYLFYRLHRYIRYGKEGFRRGEILMLAVLFTGALVYDIHRNLLA